MSMGDDKYNDYTLKGQEATEFTISFRGRDQVVTVHIPIDDLPKIGVMLNEYLQSRGIASNVGVKPIIDYGEAGNLATTLPPNDRGNNWRE